MATAADAHGLFEGQSRFVVASSAAGRREQIELGTDFEGSFAKAPRMHPNTSLFTGNGMRRPLGGGPGPLDAAIRWLDKLVDEIAKSKAMEKIRRR